MLHLPNGPAMAGELRFYKAPDGKAWHQLYRKPLVGFTIRAFDLANKEVLGYGLGAAVFFSAPVLRTERFSWNLEIGSGPGLVSKPFDYESNYKNIAIGSYLNAFIVLGQRFSYRVANNIHAVCSMSFNHFSNAAFSLPNLGLNYPMISLGAAWMPVRKDSVSPGAGVHEKIKNRWTSSLTFGLKETYHPREAKFPAFTLSAERQWGISRKSAFAPGIDIFYNTALIANREADSVSIDPIENIQLGIKINYQLHIDHLTLVLGMGAYALDSYKQDGLLYHRVGFRYYFSEHWGLNLSLKTHFFKADFFELGLAHRF